MLVTDRPEDVARADRIVLPGDGAFPACRVALERIPGLHEAIDGLGEGQRAVFVMHDLEGFTHAEIAAALQIEEGTSKARLSRARARLREVLVRSGVVAPRVHDSTGISGETQA